MVELALSEDELTRRRDRICSFIESTVDTAGVDGVVIGISGGVDSATVAMLAAEALGPDSVHGLILPAAPTAESSLEDAYRVAETAGIEYDEVDVEPMVEAIAEPYPEASTLAKGNARARVRAVYNYLVANEEGRLVLGTGNRSEILTGYFTKYGDGAVDCNPIGNLYKTQVWQLAAALGVPERVIDKPPAAELWADQSDESELGVGYAILDQILALHVDGPLSTQATADTLDVKSETVQQIANRCARNRHKREAPPTP